MADDFKDDSPSTAKQKHDHGQQLHYVYRNDPLELRSYVDKKVELTMIDGSSRQGYVYTIDPVTGSYVLYDAGTDADHLKTEIVPGHAVVKIDVQAAADNDVFSSCASKLRVLLENRPSSSEAKHPKSLEEIARRKKTVAAWLRRHLIPVADNCDGARVDDDDDRAARLPASSSLTIMNALTITPPYTPEDCCSENEIILGKVQGLLKSMPKHWNEDDISQ